MKIDNISREKCQSTCRAKDECHLWEYESQDASEEQVDGNRKTHSDLYFKLVALRDRRAMSVIPRWNKGNASAE